MHEIVPTPETLHMLRETKRGEKKMSAIDICLLTDRAKPLPTKT